MHLDDSIARYILRSIAEKEYYQNLSVEDIQMRKLLEESFPDLVQKVDADVFRNWVWNVIVNGEESVVRAQGDVDTLMSALRHASLESDCLQEELSEKLDALHVLKRRVFDQLLSDDQMLSSLKRKWQEMTKS